MPSILVATNELNSELVQTMTVYTADLTDAQLAELDQAIDQAETFNPMLDIWIHKMPLGRLSFAAIINDIESRAGFKFSRNPASN